MDKFYLLSLLLCLALAPVVLPTASAAAEYEGTEGRRGLSKLDLIELEYQADTNGLNKDSGVDESAATKQSESQSSGQQNATVSGKSISFSLVDESKTEPTRGEGRKKMLELIELEFEADANGKQPELDEAPQLGKKGDRSSMLDLIELEFEEDVKGVKRPELDLEASEQKQKVLSKLELIELELEDDIKRHEQSKLDDEEQAARKQKRERMLDLIELEFETDIADHHFAARHKKTSSATNPSGLKVLLNRLVENHNNGRVVVSSSSSTQTISSESISNLKAKINDLRGVSFRDLALRSDFDEILTAAVHLEEANPSHNYISRLAKYQAFIKEGIEASRRFPIAQSRAQLLKEIALEKQAMADAELAAAEALAEQDNELYEKITALKEQLADLEAKKESVHLNFNDIASRLSHYLGEAAEAAKEYEAAVRNVKAEEAAQEFGREAAERAETIWSKFINAV